MGRLAGKPKKDAEAPRVERA